MIVGVAVVLVLVAGAVNVVVIVAEPLPLLHQANGKTSAGQQAPVCLGRT
jgi:hypothetical protein